MFTLTSPTVQRLFALNSVVVPDAEIVLVGLRGCLPVNAENFDLVPKIDFDLADTNHQNPRCSMLVWQRTGNLIAAFAGSTVPHLKHMKKSLSVAGRGTNQLSTGYYGDYRKGIHRLGALTAHAALRQSSSAPIRRTSDDLDYESDDFTDVELAGDNIHAAWTPNTESDVFESAGCQVIVGYPKCAKRGDLVATGAWAAFWSIIDAQSQDRFGYLLLPAREARTTALWSGGNLSVKLRFGSRGAIVTRLQEILKDKGYYEGDLDDDFGPRTFRALIRFQKSAFVRSGDDGVVGQQTAEVLGLTLPNA